MNKIEWWDEDGDWSGLLKLPLAAMMIPNPSAGPHTRIYYWRGEVVRRPPPPISDDDIAFQIHSP